MEILQKDDGKNGMFYIEDQGVIHAEMTYMWTGSQRIIINHTAVAPVLQGKNIGKQLVEKAVAFAREQNIKISPICPFAKKVFDKTPEYADVLN